VHHAVVELDPDIDEIRPAYRVDPEGPADLALQLVRQRGVEQIEERLRVRSRQVLSRHEADPQAEVELS
jgi:phenylalanyl-tRNA synthetase beta subunit